MKSAIVKIVAFGMLAAMADMTVESDLRLTEDIDWRGQGQVVIASGTTVDLAGHTLKISDLSGEGAILDSSAGEGGTLELEIASGVNVVNTGVAFTGNLKLVKSGAGTLTMSKTDQTYIGGTDINAGKLQVANPGVNAIDYHGGLLPVGERGSVIRVSAGAVFNPGGNCNFNVYHIVLDGGTLANCADGYDMNLTSRESLSDIELTADSFFLGDYAMVFGQTSKTVLNGHTFTFDIANGKALFWSKIVAENGTVRLRSSGNGQFQTSQGAVDWSTVDVEVTAVLNLTQKWTVRNYTAQRTSDGNGGSAEMCVKGVFTPETDYFYGCTMQDGSTIDLSRKNAAWSLTSAFSGGRKVVGFANNATVTLDLHGRVLAVGDQVIAWGENLPGNLSGLTFVPDAATAASGVAFVANAAGVFVDDGNLVTEAWWTGAEDNSALKPANWLCKNSAGDTVENGLPQAASTVHFGDLVNFNFAEGESLACGVVVFDQGCKLAADADWRPLAFNLLQGTLDLNGHTCWLSDLKGNATITCSKPVPCPYKYFRFDVRERMNGPHFELGVLALYAADGTVQSTGITTDLSVTTPTALPPGKCFTKDTKLGQNSHYGYKDAEKVDHLFDTNLANKWCVGYLAGGATEVVTVWFRLRDDAKGVVGYNLATSYQIASLPDRRPKAWTLSGSSDGVNWVTLDVRDNQNVTTSNSTWFQSNPYPLCYSKPEECSQLHVEVGEGCSLNNSAVQITGNVRLVKEGAGTFIATKTQQTYSGGTEVVDGVLKMGSLGNVNVLGNMNNDVTICSNAVVDINGNYNNTFYHYVFKGGTLGYYGSLTGNAFYGDYEVLSEGSELAFANVNTESARFTLHGHTLRTSVARLWGNTVVADEGTIDYYCRFYVAGSSFVASNATVIVNAMSQFLGTAVIGAYVEKSTSEFPQESTNSATILKSFKADTDYFYGCKLEDGVVIDLTDRTTPLPLRSACVNSYTLTFADDAIITLDLTDSVLSRCGKVVSWEEGAAPANISTLKFKLETGRRPVSYLAQVKEDGIYLISNGTIVFVR